MEYSIKAVAGILIVCIISFGLGALLAQAT
jgi:hypothetical protein